MNLFSSLLKFFYLVGSKMKFKKPGPSTDTIKSIGNIVK